MQLFSRECSKTIAGPHDKRALFYARFLQVTEERIADIFWDTMYMPGWMQLTGGVVRWKRQSVHADGAVLRDVGERLTTTDDRDATVRLVVS